MSLLRWFSRKPDAEAAPSSTLRDSTRPPAADSRRSERSARRERLYAVVRQSMANAGVLSSSYRFKVLSLDGRGRQFLVMVDLVGAPGGDTADLGRIEDSMQHAAKTLHGIVVKAVYWREAAAAGGPRASAPSATQARSCGRRGSSGPMRPRTRRRRFPPPATPTRCWPRRSPLSAKPWRRAPSGRSGARPAQLHAADGLRRHRDPRAGPRAAASTATCAERQPLARSSFSSASARLSGRPDSTSVSPSASGGSCRSAPPCRRCGAG